MIQNMKQIQQTTAKKEGKKIFFFSSSIIAAARPLPAKMFWLMDCFSDLTCMPFTHSLSNSPTAMCASLKIFLVQNGYCVSCELKRVSSPRILKIHVLEKILEFAFLCSLLHLHPLHWLATSPQQPCILPLIGNRQKPCSCNDFCLMPISGEAWGHPGANQQQGRRWYGKKSKNKGAAALHNSHFHCGFSKSLCISFYLWKNADFYGIYFLCDFCFFSPQRKLGSLPIIHPPWVPW